MVHCFGINMFDQDKVTPLPPISHHENGVAKKTKELFESKEHYESSLQVKNPGLICDCPCTKEGEEHWPSGLRVCYQWCFYPVMFTVCIGVVVFQTVKCTREYLEYPLAATVMFTASSELLYPEITICPSFNTAYNPQGISDVGLSNQNDYRIGRQWQETENEFKNIFSAVTWNADDLLAKVEVETELGDKNTGKKAFVVDMNSTDWFVNPRKYFGRCHTLRIPKDIVAGRITEIELKFKTDILVYINYQGQSMHSNSRNSKLEGFMGKNLYIEVVFEEIRLFETEVESVVEPGKMERICDKAMNEYFDKCIFDSVFSIMMKQVNCTVPYIPGATVVCDTKENRKIAEGIYNELAKGSQGKICKNPCHTFITLFGIPFSADSGSDTKGKVKMYMKKDVKVTESYLRYPALSAVAEIGGFVGLLVGVGLLDGTYLISMMISKYYKKA